MNKIHNGAMSPVVIVTFFFLSNGHWNVRVEACPFCAVVSDEGGEVESVSFSSPVLLVLKCH